MVEMSTKGLLLDPVCEQESRGRSQEKAETIGTASGKRESQAYLTGLPVSSSVK